MHIHCRQQGDIVGVMTKTQLSHGIRVMSGTSRQFLTDDIPPALNASLPFVACLPTPDPPHEIPPLPPAPNMIRPSCAWARPGLRRTTLHPRNNLPGKPTYPEPARLWPSPSHVSRRCNASKTPVGQKAPETATTIPGPSWLWLEPIYEPFRAYGRVQQRKPYMTQFISSLVIYFVGDLVAQSIAQPAPGAEDASATISGEEEDEEKGWVQEWSENRDWARTGRALVIGGLSSIPSYRWFLWLGGSFNYSSKILSLTTKVSLRFPPPS
jgi:protein Mpv17